MIGAGDLRAIRDALGASGVAAHAPALVDGHKIDCTLRPADGPALAAALRALGDRGLAALVRGGGSRLELGNPPRRADVVISTERLSGIELLDPDEGVVHVRAGTPLVVLRDAARAQGWEPALDPPGARTSVGGALAAAAVGPRCHGLGAPRDIVLGLEVALASGARTRCGGRVVKNVTGYDLQKLYTGSLGTLGVIEAAWLRLRPRAEREAVLVVRASRLEDAVALAVGESRRPGARALAVAGAGLAEAIAAGPRDPGGAGALLVIELAGDAALVEREAARLAERAGAETVAAGALDRVRDVQGGVPSPGGLRFRLSALATRLGGTAAALERAGAEMLVYPGPGLVYARFPAAARGDESAATATVVAAVRDAARVGGGTWCLEAAPASAKRGRDVFGDPQPSWRIMRALKERFDPTGVLNPGRFAGGI